MSKELLRAFKGIVKPQSGYSKHLAEELGMSQQVLLNKVSMTCDTHHLTVEQGLELQLLSGNHAPFHIEADVLGYKVERVDKPEPRVDLMSLHMEFTSESSEALLTASNGLMDGKLTMQESLSCEKELLDVIDKANEYVSALRAQRGE